MLQQLAQKGARADWVGSVLVAPALACSAATARPWVAWAQGGGRAVGRLDSERRSHVRRFSSGRMGCFTASRPASGAQAHPKYVKQMRPRFSLLAAVPTIQ